MNIDTEYDTQSVKRQSSIPVGNRYIECYRREKIAYDLLYITAEVWSANCHICTNMISKVTECSPIDEETKGRPRRSKRDEVDEAMDKRNLDYGG